MLRLSAKRMRKLNKSLVYYFTLSLVDCERSAQSIKDLHFNLMRHNVLFVTNLIT